MAGRQGSGARRAGAVALALAAAVVLACAAGTARAASARGALRQLTAAAEERRSQRHRHARRHGGGSRAGSSADRLTSADGAPLPSAFNVPLTRSSVDARHLSRFLSNLKLVQQGLRDGDAAFLEEVPLQEQVLNEKRLATYYGQIMIGNQPFKVLFDTGSCEFWIPSAHCAKHTDRDRCSKHDMFNAGASHTFREFPSHQKMSIQYLSGKVEGPLGTDTIGLGPLKVTGQPFGMADTIDVPLLDDVVWDGIVGLAYPNERLSQQGVHPLFDTIMRHKLLQNNVFSYYLGFNGGAITFGGVDQKYIAAAGSHAGSVAFSHTQSRSPSPARFAERRDAALVQLDASRDGGEGGGDAAAAADDDGSTTMSLVEAEEKLGGSTFVYAEVQEKSYWTVDIVDIELTYKGDAEPRRTGVCSNNENGRCRAIVDTGTYLIYGPRSDVTGALGDLQLSACADIHSLPAVTFVLYAGEDADPARLTLHPHDYTLEFHVPQQDGTDCNDPAERSDEARCKPDCVIGIGPDDDSGWTLGQVFLRSFYSVFDRDRDRIGFTRSNPRAL